MFEQLIAKMDEVGGLFKGKPMSDESFQKLNEEMKSLNIELPDEYAELLFTMDGLYWGGLEFFASQMHSDKRHGVNITDLYSQNRIFQALNPDKTDCIILGHSDDESYIYNSKRKKYQIVEEFENNVIKSFKSFEELFNYIITEQIEIVEHFVAFDENAIKDDSTDMDF